MALSPPRRLLLLTFIESFATICLERGVYFYGKDILHFTDATNLWLALAFGAAYASGALASHRASGLLGEKMLLALTIAGQFAVHVSLTAWPVAAAVFAGNVLLGLLNGAKWPVIESYVGAGHEPAATARAIGRFNVSWALAVPLALIVAGPLIGSRYSWALFALPALLNLCALGLIGPLAARPTHLAIDHPQRPSPQRLARLAALVVASRWLMLFSYVAMFVLAPLMPSIFARLGFDVKVAPALSGVIDLVRVLGFLLLAAWGGWHGRTWPITWSLLGLPLGLAMTASGAGLAVVLAGELIFGFSAAAIYAAAMYSAMVVKNAAVSAGGGHEGLIGLGFAIGPGAALLGMLLSPLFAGSRLAQTVPAEILGVLAGVAPVFIICAAGALAALREPGKQA